MSNQRALEMDGLLVYGKTSDEFDDVLKQLYQVYYMKMFGSNLIAVMPDYHVGKGCVIGFTAKLKDVICPSIIGVDIGCGVKTCKFKSDRLLECMNDGTSLVDLREQLNSKIHTGNKKVLNQHRDAKIDVIIEWSNYFNPNNSLDIIELDGLYQSQIGTLGGGNHFIELGFIEETEEFTFTIHSGSRRYGFDIGNYYSRKALDLCHSMKVQLPDNDLAYFPIASELGKGYIRESELARIYASISRHTMIVVGMNTINAMFGVNGYKGWKMNKQSLQWFSENCIESIHNMIGDDLIVRKGAISARKDEDVIIPFNMSEGLIIGKGKGNRDWNYSAPHGAGRSRSTSKSRELYNDMSEEIKESIKNVVTNDPDTIKGELPHAYKNPDDVKEFLDETVEILYKSKPILNIKG